LELKHTISTEILATLLPILLLTLFVSFIVWPDLAMPLAGLTQMPSIKITSPIKGETISTSSNLTISGSAAGTNNASHGTGIFGDDIPCLVSVIVNDLKPYHNVTAHGPNGDHDYSKWSYVIHTPEELKQGQNKITAKLDCLQSRMIGTNSSPSTNTNLNLIKWYSLDVTGATTKKSIDSNQTISNSTLGLQHPQHRYNSEHNTTSMNNATTATSQNQSSKLSSPSTFSETKSKNASANYSSTFSEHAQKPSTSKSNYYIKQKSMSVSVESTQNVVNGKGTSTVKATANDAASGKKLENATIKLMITFTSNGTSKLIVGHNGLALYSTNLNPKLNHRNDLGFTASAQASAPGYISTSKTTTSSLSSSISGGTSSRQESILNSSSTANLTQSILNDVQNKLKHAGIYTSIG